MASTITPYASTVPEGVRIPSWNRMKFNRAIKEAQAVYLFGERKQTKGGVKGSGPR